MNKTTKTTQKQIIYNALLSGRTLTASQASDEFGVDRLAARIHELRHIGKIVGFEIEREYINFINQHTGNPGKCAAYRLVKIQDAL